MRAIAPHRRISVSAVPSPAGRRAGVSLVKQPNRLSRHCEPTGRTNAPQPPPSSRRTPGPIRRDVCWDRCRSTAFMQRLKPVVMGPCFRRDDENHSRGAISPGVCQKFPYPRDQRAQGIPGARCTRGLVCKVAQKNAHEHTGSAEAVRHSLRNGFTAYFVLSPAIRLCCHRRPRKLVSANLNANHEASEPHDFAVRLGAVRQKRRRVHRIRSQRS